VGILGDAFGKLFSVLWAVITWVGTAIRDFFSWLGRLLWDAFLWLAEFLRDALQAVVDLLIGFFSVIYAVIDGLFYLFYKIGVLAVQLFLLFFDLGRLAIAFFTGFARTLGSLFYSPRASGGHGYSEMLGQIFSAAAGPLQLNVIAYILLFLIWVSTAVLAIRWLSSIRVGGD